jgi:hypothetical protein
MVKWIKLEKIDNWGKILYKSKDTVFKKPTHAIVQWPSGHREKCKVISKDYSGEIYDMGHKYTVCSTLWFIKATHRGLKIEVPIEKVLIAVENKKILKTPEGA